MRLVRGSLLALVVLALACSTPPSSGPSDSASPSPSEPSAHAASDTASPASATPETTPPPREEPAVVASPSTPTPRATIETPQPPASPAEDSVVVKGQLIHPDLSPVKDACIIVGPQAIRCAALSGADGQFAVQLPMRFEVTWTMRYFVNGEEKGHQTVAGPFQEKSFQLPAFSIP